MHVLQLVTNEDAAFFRQQVKSLEALGITSDVRSPDGLHTGTQSRSIGAYVRMAVETFQESPDKYDLVHANYGLTAPAAFLQSENPTVLSLWGSDLLGRLGPVSRLCAKYADDVIVMTPQMADQLGSPSHVIPHGIDLTTFKPIPREKARQETGWRADRKHVLFPYDPERPLKDFSKAASVVGAVRAQLDIPVELHALSDVSHSRMPYYYNSADALLLTSKREGSPNTVREALACNRPVIATDVGDIRSHLNGLSLSSVGQRREELIDALRRALTADEHNEGRSRARETSAAEMAAELKRVYENAIADREEDCDNKLLHHYPP